MGCNHDEGCYRISKNYDSYSSEIDEKLTVGMNDINEIMDIINQYDIPDDYLGNKVKENIKNIIENFTDDTNDISNLMADIKNFTAEKSKIHMQHYYDWKEEQLALEENNKEEKLEN